LNYQTADYEKTVRPAERAADEMADKRYEAVQTVFDIVPPTLGGLRAKIDFAMSADHVTDCLRHTETDEPLRDFLNAVYESARLLAVRS